MLIDLAVLKQAVGDLDEDLVMDMLNTFLEDKPDSVQTQDVVTACQEGMEIVGDIYEKGDYFVGDLIFAGELLTSCIHMLKPLLRTDMAESSGTIVIGTVEGDIHDIGKNIFKIMIEAAGFRIIDIGIDQPPEAFVEAVREHRPDIVGFSGVLTLSINSMKRTVEALAAGGLRDHIKITIGGNAVSAEACRSVGADAWSKNAAETVKVCREWMRKKSGLNNHQHTGSASSNPL